MSGTRHCTQDMMVYIGTDTQYPNNKMTIIPTHITILAGEWTQLNTSFSGHFFFLSFTI